MMFKTNRPALIGVVFFISVLHVAVAFDVDDISTASGELLSLTINQCPDMSGDACRFNYSLPLELDIKFKTRVPFERINIYFFFSNSLWLFRNPEITQPRNMALWSDADYCQTDDSFCPGRVGDERTFYVELDLSETADIWATPGKFSVIIKNERLVDIINVDFPIVGYS